MTDPRDVGAVRTRLDRLLRSCIQCGLCLPHCATYLATGDETQSPRGRLLLLGRLLAEPARAPDSSALTALDHCLGCLACVSACPSGVAADLLEAVKERGHAARRGALTPLLARTVSQPAVLTALRRPAALARAAMRASRRAGGAPAGPPGRSRLARLIASVPWTPDDRALARLLAGLIARADGGSNGAEPSAEPWRGAPAVASPPPPRVALFRGCANRALLPASQRRLRALLAAAGCEVVVPEGQSCCGALATHVGQPALAARQRDGNVAALAAAACDVVVVEAAGCGRELKQAPAALAERVRDAAVLLAQLALPPARAVPLRVVYHDPCHARHGQGIVSEPRALLARIPGLHLLEPEEAEACCGSGGPYALLHPELAARMGWRKAGHLAATGADLVVTSNPGCLGQIQAALRDRAPALPILPLTDLLWYACLGACPP